MNGWKWEYIITSTLFNIKTFFFVANPLISSYLPIIIFLIHCLTRHNLSSGFRWNQKRNPSAKVILLLSGKVFTTQHKVKVGTNESTWDRVNYPAGFELIIILLFFFFFFFPWMLTTSVGTWQHYVVSVSVSLRDAARDAGVCDCACNERAWDKDCLTENKYHY